MIAKIIYYCNMARWFIVGGRKPVNNIKMTQSKKDNNVYANWSKAEYQMHFRNAASNRVYYMKQEHGGMNNHWNIEKKRRRMGRDTEKTGENTWYYNLDWFWEEKGLNLVMIH